MNNQDIFSYIKAEQNKYETQEIRVGENWFWSMRNHIQLIFHLKNGVFFTGQNDWMRAFKNIMEGIIELANWTEDIEVKDITFFIEGDDDRALSFLVKKYHDEVYVREHDIDKMIDDITESDNDYGGVLVQKGLKRPEVIKLTRVAFCDQTKFDGGPLGFKHNFDPSSLRSMSKYGWGDRKNGATITINELITLADEKKDANGSLNEKENLTTGKTVEVYIVRGDLPESYLKDDGDPEKSVRQLQIVAFYTDKDSRKLGVTLYRKEESEEDGLIFFSSSEVDGRALGRGVGEKLIHPQIWTNWTAIHKNSLLEAASKVPLVTDDENFTNKNKIIDMESLEVTTIADGKEIKRIETAAVNNISVFNDNDAGWYQHAQFIGQAFDSLMGKEESAGTTFRGQERLVQQGRGPHDRRRGQRAKFIELIYRSWIIPDIIKEISKGKKFLATLSLDELKWVAERMATKAVNERVKDIVLNHGGMLNGRMMTTEDQMMMTEVFKQSVFKKGNKQLHEIVKGELEEAEGRLGLSIAGKQKNLAGLSDKILSIVEVAMTNPQFRASLEANGMTKNFNDLLEYSGLSPADFSTVANTQPVLSPMQQPQLKAPKMMQENGRTA